MDCKKYFALGGLLVLAIGCQKLHTPSLPVLPEPFQVPATAGERWHDEATANVALSVPPTPAVSVPEPVLEPDLWRDLRRSMHLPRRLEERRVQQELAWFKRNPRYLQRMQSRLQTYLPYLYRETQLKNLPAELALLPIVESALDVYAFSHGGAAGPWQFISGTARQYGLGLNTWYDGRRDIIAATDAALRYLTDLHNEFDAWPLALAGYNAGSGNVRKALRKNPGGDFFDLALPRETRAYVPRLLALAEVVANPGQYGIQLPDVVPEQTFTSLATHSQFQIDKLAGAIGISVDELYRWNPALNQWATPPKGPHRVIVSAAVDTTKAQRAIDAIPASARVDWTAVTIRSGDTLSTIARRHGTDVASLKLANNLSTTRIRAGKRLLIPVNPEALHSAPGRGRKSGSQHAEYVVKTGDSLWSIARQYNLKTVALMKANHIGPKDALAVGRKLKIPGQAGGDSVVRKVRYKVRRGDSLSRIAGKFKVSISDIVAWNDLNRSKYLQPGQALNLFVTVVGG